MSEDLLREILGKANQNDPFRQLLLRAQEAHALVQAFVNPHNLDEFIIGYVRSVGPDTCTMEERRATGETDGNNTFYLRDVIQVSTDTRLLRRIELLEERTDTVIEEEVAPEVPDCIQAELEQAQTRRELVNCKLATPRDFRHVSGFVRALINGYAEIELITMEGDPDGVATIRIADIATVYRNERRQQAAMLFYGERDRLYPEMQ